MESASASAATGPVVVVAIATGGRPTILRETLIELGRQSSRPARILVCHSKPDDIAGVSPDPDTEFLIGPPGLVDKRNVLLAAARACDIILFLDDDFLPDPDYIAVTRRAFATYHDVVVTTGAVIADGIDGPGLTVEQARRVIASPAAVAPVAMQPALNGYGCNMAIRMAIAREHDLRFDDRLPLYGWFEDVDFTLRVGRHGRVVKLNQARGVHLGVKLGRGSGVRLGYSQIANPIYLARKGSCPPRKAWHFVLRNCAMNMLRSIRPEPYIDRRGRLRGNLLGLSDLLTGALEPRRVLRL